MDTNKILLYQMQYIKHSTVWITFVFLGWSYGSMNQILMQYLYYLTLGGLGIWFLYRLFTLNKAINEYNSSIAYRLGFDLTDRITLGAIL